MTSVARVHVQCSTCEVETALMASPLARLREQLRTFFTEHATCETRIDLADAPGLRLLPLRAEPEHACG